MNFKSYLLISFWCIIIGLITFAYHKEWIILNFPVNKKQEVIKPLIIKKKCRLFYFKENSWHHEQVLLLWKEDSSESSFALISQWLLLLQEEKIIKKKIILESAVECNQELFLSFNQSLLDSESPTFEKLTVINSLFKTVLENEIAVKKIRLLVNHQPLQDAHLDFTNAWNSTNVLTIS